MPDPTEASLEALIGALMADGRTWDVDATYEAVKRSGVPTDRAAINSILYRGSRRADGRFAAVARGQYRLRDHQGNGVRKVDQVPH